MQLQHSNRPSQPFSLRPILAAAATVCAGILLVISPAASQQDAAQPGGNVSEGVEAEFGDEEDEGVETVEDPRPLYRREPFDRITLDGANDNAVLHVVPLERPLPDRPSGLLRIRLLENRTQEYEVAWQRIEKVELFEEMMLEQAEQLTAEKDFDEAFRHLDYLARYYPDLPGLQNAQNDFLLASAVDAHAQGRPLEMFSILEELRTKSPDYRPQAVLNGLNSVTEVLLRQYVERDEMHAAQTLLQRLERDYGDQLRSVPRWRSELISRATEQLERAQQLMEEGRLREAYVATREMLRIYPQVPGGLELAQEIFREYPLLHVAVTQPATIFEPNRIENWPARRSGRLLHRMLLEFVQPGPDGGQYTFPLGTVQLSEDRQQLTFGVRRQAGGANTPLTSFDLSQRLLDLASPSHPDYIPAWASLVSSVRVKNALDVEVDLRRPHVLPSAVLLTRYGDSNATPDSGSGPYRIADQSPQAINYLLKEDYPLARSSQPREIVERYFEQPDDAIQALLRGEVDLIDHLFPADARRLRGNPEVEVERYAMPNVHLLVPVSDHPYLANRTFRRALVYGIDRFSILQQELLGGQQIEGCQVISGPFSAGMSADDTLGYAYDHAVEPLEYNPRLAFTLALTAQYEVKLAAQRRGETVGDLIEMIAPRDEEEEQNQHQNGDQQSAANDSQEAPVADEPQNSPAAAARPLVIGYPAHEVPRVASQAIAAQLNALRIPCELKELPPGYTFDPDGECDLIYITAAVWEPIVDARRLLGPDGVAGSNNPYVNLLLRQLEAARNWREVRERLHELHQRVHHEVTVIPLWQTVDHFAYRKGLQGIGPRPVSLYQDIERWTVEPRISID